MKVRTVISGVVTSALLAVIRGADLARHRADAFQRLMQLSRDGRGFAQSDAGFQRGRTRIPGMRAVSDPQPPGPELVCEPLAELVEQLREALHGGSKSGDHRVGVGRVDKGPVVAVDRRVV